jgi:hypothetical protein
MTVIVDHSGELKAVNKYGVHAYDANNNIVAIKGMTLKVENFSELNFVAWVDGTKGEGATQNEAIKNAITAKKEQQIGK